MTILKLSDVKTFLSQNNIFLKKSLGQNFLIDHNSLRKIYKCITDYPSNLFIEVGTGMGMLSQFFINENKRLYSIEIDKRFKEFLISKFNFKVCSDFPEYFEDENLLILNDALKITWDNIYKYRKNITICGNIPYQITSPLFFILMDIYVRKNIPLKKMVFVIQKEVGERILALPSSKEYGILSVILQSFFHIKKEFVISEKCFFPEPKVKSICISLLPKNKTISPEKYAIFKFIVKKSFENRRKKVVPKLRKLFDDKFVKDFLKKFSYSENIRAENITPQAYLWLICNYPKDKDL